MNAQKKDQWLRIHYRNLENQSETYTDLLHSSEVAINRSWLNTVIKVEVMPDYDPNGKAEEIIKGEPAKKYIEKLTAVNVQY